MLAQAVVVSVEGARATVRPHVGNGSCGCSGTCGVDWRVLAGGRRATFEVGHDGTAQAADLVTVHVPDGEVAGAALRVYALPVAGVLAAVAAATALGAGDGVAALAGVAAFAGSAWVLTRGRRAAVEPFIVPARCAGLNHNESIPRVLGRTT